METLSAYAHAIAALALVGLMGLVMGPVVGRMKAQLGLPPGAAPDADYGSAAYRWHRAYENLTESIGFFAAAALAAILAGSPPLWVNLLASVFLVARIVMAVIHVSGLGRADMSLRSFAFGAGWLASIGLALLALAEVFSGV